MLYKNHKEPFEVGTAVRSLISVILYNVYNVMEWGTIQRDTARYNTIQRDTTPYSEIQHHTAQKRQKRAANLQPVNP